MIASLKYHSPAVYTLGNVKVYLDMIDESFRCWCSHRCFFSLLRLVLIAWSCEIFGAATQEQ